MTRGWEDFSERDLARIEAATKGRLKIELYDTLVAGPEQRTLPREMFSGLRDSITPALTAVATIMIVVSTTLFLLMQALQRRARRSGGGAA